MEQKKKSQIELDFEEAFGLQEQEEVDSRPVELAFGNGLVFRPIMLKNTDSSGGKIFKDGQLLGSSDISPISSCENGGLFLVFEDKKNRTYRLVDSDGNFSKRVFGKESSQCCNGFARVEIIDEKADRHPVFTFAKIGEDGRILLMKSRFSHASFIDKCGLGRVRLVGEEKFAFVTKKGYVLPYRFCNAEQCSRDGMFNVILDDGSLAKLRTNFDLVKISATGKITVITTLKDFLKKKAEAETVGIEEREEA
ncbi:MAG: hypothetical protein IJX25_03895 [Clostridia bacterium]|nr:hypothetical protein [Clostridia bacterium]